MPDATHSFERARDMYEAVAEHVRTTGHTNLRAVDDADRHTIGVLCTQCHDTREAPYPRAGQFDHWPRDMTDMTVQGRHDYVRALAQTAFKKPDAPRNTVWQRLIEEDAGGQPPAHGDPLETETCALKGQTIPDDQIDWR